MSTTRYIARFCPHCGEVHEIPRGTIGACPDCGSQLQPIGPEEMNLLPDPALYELDDDFAA